MPRGPKGEKRPADVIGNAVKVMKIAVGEESDDTPPDDVKSTAAQELGRLGGIARSRSVSAEMRRETARKAAQARWNKKG